MRRTAGVVGLVGALLTLGAGMMYFVAGGILMGLPGGASAGASTATVIQAGFAQVGAAAIALAFSVVLLANRMPRAASAVLMAAGLLAVAFQGWLGAVLIAAGLLGLTSGRRRPSVHASPAA
jgi:hypothetical protein